MAHFTTTLRDIIYHYSQEYDPITIAERVGQETGRYPFILPGQDVPVEQRIKTAQDSIISSDIKFYNEEMKSEFWMQFCLTNLMREIEYEEVSMWILQFNLNIRRVIWRYNKLYETLSADIDLLNSHRRQLLRNTNGNENRRTTDHGTSSSTSSNKEVFEDTPESSLGNSDYATSITNTSGNASGETNGEGTDNSSYSDHEDLIETGFDGPQGEILKKNRDSLVDVVGAMVDECSKRIFLKLYMYD